MDNEIIEHVASNKQAMGKELEELKRQKYLPLLPNTFLEIPGDPRSTVLLTLSWLLNDLYDCNWYGFTPLGVAKMLREISEAIINSSAQE